MRGAPRASFIIALAEEHPMLPRLLQSLALQHGGLEEAEVVLAGPRRVVADAHLWEAVLGKSIRMVCVPKGASEPSMRNMAMAEVRSELIHFPNPQDRLDRNFLREILDAAEDEPDADIIYSDFVRMSPNQGRGASGIIRLSPFEDEQLRQRNFLGNAHCIRTDLYATLGPYREEAIYFEWDFHVRAAQSGRAFLHIAYPLLSLAETSPSFRERALDGRGKAMLVIANPAYFHEHTMRWALSHLRGEKWAVPWKFGSIPTAMDVARMQQEYAMINMGTAKTTRKAVRNFQGNVIPFTA